MSLADSLERALKLEHEIEEELKLVVLHLKTAPRGTKDLAGVYSYGIKLAGQKARVREIIQQIDDEMMRDFREDTT